VVFTCLGVLQYLLDFILPIGAAAVRPFFLVAPPSLMLLRMAWGLPPLPGRPEKAG